METGLPSNTAKLLGYMCLKDNVLDVFGTAASPIKSPWRLVTPSSLNPSPSPGSPCGKSMDILRQGASNHDLWAPVTFWGRRSFALIFSSKRSVAAGMTNFPEAHHKFTWPNTVTINCPCYRNNLLQSSQFHRVHAIVNQPLCCVQDMLISDIAQILQLFSSLQLLT